MLANSELLPLLGVRITRASETLPLHPCSRTERVLSLIKEFFSIKNARFATVFEVQSVAVSMGGGLARPFRLWPIAVSAGMP